eukprot:5402836-Prymnesium_polylepis.1
MAARLLSWPDTERFNTRELDFLGRLQCLPLDFGHVRAAACKNSQLAACRLHAYVRRQMTLRRSRP